MIGIIKTAIITIIISFISGVLLDFYKSKAPKVLCSIKKDKPMMLGGKKINAYSLRIKNASNKTIHDLNLNVQGHYDNFKLDNAKITKGLKFDISEEDEVYDVSIPFLCKNDEFTARVFAYSRDNSIKKPFITLRSPEKFKKVYSEKENGAVNAICNEVSNHKKAIAAVILILVIVYAGITIGEHFGKIGSKVNADSINNTINSIKKSANPSDSGLKKGSENNNAGKSSPAVNTGSDNKSNTRNSLGKSGESINKPAKNKKEEPSSPSGNGSDAVKSSEENNTGENQPAKKSETQSGTSVNEGREGTESK